MARMQGFSSVKTIWSTSLDIFLKFVRGNLEPVFAPPYNYVHISMPLSSATFQLAIWFDRLVQETWGDVHFWLNPNGCE